MDTSFLVAIDMETETECAIALVLLSFDTTSVLVKHTKEMKKKKTARIGRFECPVTACSCFYKRKGDLKVHMQKSHVASETVAYLTSIMKPRSSVVGKPFVCPYPKCRQRYGYMRARGLRRHINDKHHGRPTPCSKRETNSSSDMSCDTMDDSY